MKQVKISEVLELLKNGKSRKEIKYILDLNTAEAQVLFSHSSIKGKKRKNPIDLTIIDDTKEANTETSNEELAYLDFMEEILEPTEELVESVEETIEYAEETVEYAEETVEPIEEIVESVDGEILESMSEGEMIQDTIEIPSWEN